MLLSHSKKFVTIDIPKTGTRSLRETLLESGFVDFVGSHLGDRKKIWQHSEAKYIKKVFDESNLDWDSYYKYTVVRNPWDKYVSGINYSFESFNRRGLFKTKSKMKQEFCDFLKRTRNFTTQKDYITDEHGEIIVDQVSNFDNLQQEFDGFCSNVNIKKTKLKHSNLSEKMVTKECLFNQESIDIIYEREKFVIDMMGYSF
jgi:hypothetical protein